jgi:hypothetical protein
MANNSFNPNGDKFRELVLYLATKSECDKHFGAVKLNKQLFYCDFLAYQIYGKSITGQRYQKLDHGPAPRALLPVVRDLETEGAVVQQDRLTYGKHTQRRVVALRDADLSAFSAEEIALVDKVLDELRDFNAASVSDLSHRFLGWKLARVGEDIPYQVALVSLVGRRREPTEKERELGRELEEKARAKLVAASR